jgi:hypothetical protein
MTLIRNIGLILLAIWLIVWGVAGLVPIHNLFVQGGLCVLAIVGGIVILTGR